MNSTHLPFAKRAANAPEPPKRPPSNSYAGGDYFSNAPKLRATRPPPPHSALTRSTQPPPPQQPDPYTPQPAPSGPSAFQPRSRGQRHPPQNRLFSSAPAQPQHSTSRSRRLSCTPPYISNDAMRDVQNKTAPTLFFSDSTVRAARFKQPPPPPPMPKPNVVDLVNDAAPARASSSHVEDLEPECVPPPPPFVYPSSADTHHSVPEKKSKPSNMRHRNHLAYMLNPVQTSLKPTSAIPRSNSLPAYFSEPSRREHVETINVEEEPLPVSPPQPQQTSRVPQQTVILTLRSPSPRPRPTSPTKAQQVEGIAKFARKRPRQPPQQPPQQPPISQPAFRRSLRLQDKSTPDSSYLGPMHPFSPSFSTAERRSPDVLSPPRSVATKRPRVTAPPENDDKVIVVQSTGTKRPRQRLFLCHEQTPFDREQAVSILQKQNSRYIVLSFLGICDTDLHDLFDCDIPNIASAGRHIELNNNRLRQISAHLFHRLQQLKVESLIVSSNQLTQIHQSIATCSELQTLDLSRNNLKGLPVQICDLSNLVCLKVSDNKITKLPSALRLLTKLKILNVARNNIESLPEVSQDKNALTALDVSGNKNFHLFPSSCKHWSHLEDLILTNTAIFAYLTKRERKLPPVALLDEVAGKPLDHLKNRTRKRKPPARYKGAPDPSATNVS